MAKSLFPYVAEDGLMGYKDFDGNVKIAAQWDQVKSFGYSVGFLAAFPGNDTAPARVRKGSKWGIIAETGDYLLPCEYDEISFGVYDRRVYYELVNYYYDESRRRMEKGLAELSGRLLFQPCKDHLYTVRDGVAIFTDGMGGKITKTVKLNLCQDLPSSSTEGARILPVKDLKVMDGCLVDIEGKALTERLDHISRFFYDRAYVELKTRSGVIDVDGNFIVPLTSKLKRITTFKQGYAECKVKTKEGFVPGIIDLWGGVKVLG